MYSSTASATIPWRILGPATALTLLLGLGGCTTVGPDYTAPAAQLPPSFKHASTQEVDDVSSATLEPWWSVFDDPVLDQLEREALAANPGLAAVMARVNEARARLGITRAETRPSLAASEGAQFAGESAERTIPIPGNPITYRDSGDGYRIAFEASYELDLWGRVRRSLESAGAQYAASEADARGARLALSVDLAQTYFLLRGLEQELAIVHRTLASRRDALAVLEVRVAAGLINELDMHRARTEIAGIEADAADLTRRRELAANALAVLSGRAPADFALATTASPLPDVPAVPAGIPADVIARRPDIAAAEALLHARTAEIGVATAARYPNIRLTAGAGVESNDLSQLLQRPAQFWQVGQALSVPLLDGGRIDANIEAAYARAEAARADHRQRTLVALREVEDALIDLHQQAEQSAAIARSQASAHTALELTQTRYNSGLISYLEVLDAQRSTLQADRTATQLQTARFASTLRLIRSISGGF